MVIVCCGVGIIVTDPFGFLILARTLLHLEFNPLKGLSSFLLVHFLIESSFGQTLENICYHCSSSSQQIDYFSPRSNALLYRCLTYNTYCVKIYLGQLFYYAIEFFVNFF